MRCIRLAPFLASPDQSLKGVGEPGSPPAAGRPVQRIVVSAPPAGKHARQGRRPRARREAARVPASLTDPRSPGRCAAFRVLALLIRSGADKASCGNRLQVGVFVRSIA